MTGKMCLPALMLALLMLVAVGCGNAGPAETPSAVEELLAPVGATAPETEVPPAIAVRYLEGEVLYRHDGAEAPLAMDTLLYQGDAVVTGGDGMAVLKLDGDKQVQLAPGSHVEISGFERGVDGDKTLLFLHAGNIINVLDAPLDGGDSYEVETPGLVMAIRGTIASVSSGPEHGTSRVLLFEGQSTVSRKPSGDAVEISAGGCAQVVDGRLEQGDFEGTQLNENEYWFLYEATYATMFDEPGQGLAQRLKPLLDAHDYRGQALAAGAGDAPAEDAPQSAGASPAAGPAGSEPASEPAPPAGPPATGEPAVEEPVAETPAEGGAAGMDEAAFRAIEQEFLQAKEDYNKGLIGKDAFLAIKQRYIEAKRLYYGE